MPKHIVFILQNAICSKCLQRVLEEKKYRFFSASVSGKSNRKKPKCHRVEKVFYCRFRRCCCCYFGFVTKWSICRAQTHAPNLKHQPISWAQEVCCEYENVILLLFPICTSYPRLQWINNIPYCNTTKWIEYAGIVRGSSQWRQLIIVIYLLISRGIHVNINTDRINT